MLKQSQLKRMAGAPESSSSLIFSIKESAQARWHYTPEDAERTQTYMIENAFEVAKRADHDKGLEIIIEDTDV